MAKIISVNISEQKGTVKNPAACAILRRDWGIVGDAHAGNWHRQISMLAKESIAKIEAMGISGLTPGKFGENITTEGIELHTLPVGRHLALGECVVEITQIGKECHNTCEIFRQVGKCIMPLEGIFVKVITEGTLKAGDKVSVCFPD